MSEPLSWGVGAAALLTVAMVVVWIVWALRTARRPRWGEPVFTRHARERMTQRNISTKQVAAVLRNPQLVKRDAVQNSFVLHREVNGRTLKVMVAETWPPTSSPPVIKTTAWGDASATFTIPPGQRGRVIGVGGSTVQGIQRSTGTRISVRPDRTVRITAPDQESVEAAKRAIEAIIAQK